MGEGRDLVTGRFLEGNPGNPNSPGRPPKKKLRQLLQEVMAEQKFRGKLNEDGKTTAQLFVEFCVLMGFHGDTADRKLLWEYHDGKLPDPKPPKPRQSMERLAEMMNEQPREESGSPISDEHQEERRPDDGPTG